MDALIVTAWFLALAVFAAVLLGIAVSIYRDTRDHLVAANKLIREESDR